MNKVEFYYQLKELQYHLYSDQIQSIHAFNSIEQNWFRTELPLIRKNIIVKRICYANSSKYPINSLTLPMVPLQP